MANLQYYCACANYFTKYGAKWPPLFCNFHPFPFASAWVDKYHWTQNEIYYLTISSVIGNLVVRDGNPRLGDPDFFDTMTSLNGIMKFQNFNFVNPDSKPVNLRYYTIWYRQNKFLTLTSVTLTFDLGQPKNVSKLIFSLSWREAGQFEVLHDMVQTINF